MPINVCASNEPNDLSSSNTTNLNNININNAGNITSVAAGENHLINNTNYLSSTAINTQINNSTNEMTSNSGNSNNNQNGLGGNSGTLNYPRLTNAGTFNGLQTYNLIPNNELCTNQNCEMMPQSQNCNLTRSPSCHKAV
jgi:hypothetical protein